MTRIDKLANDLKEGRAMTVKEIMKRSKLGSAHSVTGTICKLREEGFDIYLYDKKGKTRRYGLSNLSKTLGKKGYRVLTPAYRVLTPA